MSLILAMLAGGLVPAVHAQALPEKARVQATKIGSAESPGAESPASHERPAPGPPGEARHITPDLLRRPVYEDISQKAAALRRASLERAALQSTGPGGHEAQEPQTGDERHFQVRSVLDPSQWREVQARLLHRSRQVQIWLETHERERLASRGLLQPALDSLRTYLEERTPDGSLDPAQGILPIEHEFIGRAPDVDGDGRLDVLLFDIRDDFAQTGAYVAGFFDPIDLTQEEHSNRRDLLYVDTRPTLVYEDTLRIEETAATIAHEYQHLIQARYQGERREHTFVSEGLSEVAEILCGFPPRPTSAYFRQPGRALLSWDYVNPLPDYARASLFMHYLFERIGYEHVRALAQSPKVGREGISAILREAGSLRFTELFRDWGRALFRGPEADHGYRHPARRALQFNDFYAFDVLPDVKRVYLPPLSHAPARFPLTEELSLEARGETKAADIVFSGRATYPTGPDHFTAKLGRVPLQMRADARSHGSIEMLASNVSPPSAVADSERTGSAFLLAEGKRSGRRRVLSYDDDAADPYSGNASYLLLDGPGEAAALTFGPQAVSWLYGVGVKALFLSEVEGTGVPSSAPRAVTLRIHHLEDGRPGPSLTPLITRALRRPFGSPNTAFVSLQTHYDALAALADSFVVTLQSGSAENPMAVALDRTADAGRAEAGSAFYAPGERAWQPMAEVRAEGVRLEGYRPMLRAYTAAQEETALPGALQAEVRHDLEQVYVRLHAPFALNAEAARLSARLPSGRLVDGHRRAPRTPGPFSETDTTGVIFTLPLEAGGGYQLHAKVEAQGNALLAARGTFQWKPSMAGGFALGESYPNPSHAGRPAHVRLLLLEEARVNVALYDARGRRVRRPVKGQALSQGLHRLRLRLDGLSSGVYFARVQVHRSRDGQTDAKTRKLVLVR